MNPFEQGPRATTDQDGFYRIANVPPGNYEVSPAAPAFVPADIKQPRGKTVLVGEDENVENINFALVRGGVITGRVTDADGRPVIQQQVNIFRAEAFETAAAGTTASGFRKRRWSNRRSRNLSRVRADAGTLQSWSRPQRRCFQPIFQQRTAFHVQTGFPS